jgi:hypothetical protein
VKVAKTGDRKTSVKELKEPSSEILRYHRVATAARSDTMVWIWTNTLVRVRKKYTLVRITPIKIHIAL